MEISQEKPEAITVEEASKLFDKLYNYILNYEETLSEQINPYLDTIQKFQLIQQTIINNGLFSPNEELSEIPTENLKYLLLPYYIGETFGRIQDNRRKNLEFSKIYFNEFIKLLDHYEILPKEIKKYWKYLNDNLKYEFSREEKIANFKEKKAIENKIKNIEKIKDDQQQREVFKMQMQICVYQTLDNLKSMNMEFQVLDYKDKLNKNPEEQKQFEEELQKPLPKLKVWNIPKHENIDLPYLVNNPEQKHLCQPCYNQTMSEVAQQKKAQVWNASNMPTLTLDQVADYEIMMMKKNQESNKKAQEEQKKKDEQDQDKDVVSDQKTLEQRNWDDWKDQHEKGEGNRMGK